MPPKGWRNLSIREDTYRRLLSYIEKKRVEANVSALIDSLLKKLDEAEKPERMQEGGA